MLDLTKKPPAQPANTYVDDGLRQILTGRVNDPALYDGTLANYLRRMHVAKILALWEAFRLVQDLPGSVVELGVFKGQSLLLFGKFMEIMNPNDRSCSVIGFDNFTGFTKLHEKDGGADRSVGRDVGGWSPANFYEELKAHIHLFDFDRYVGHKPRIELVEGDIQKAVPEYVERNPGLSIRLLNLDADMYDPTMTGLKHLYHRVVTGGVILLDEYAFNEFPGETAAVRDFFEGKVPRIRKFPFTSNPGGYFIKE